jgi:hypothetical protein
MKRARNDGGQARQRQDVDGVVMKHRHQAKDFVRPHVFEIDIRNQFTGKIALPFHAQDLIFQFHQPATVESQVPQPARAEQQIQMLQRTERRPLPRHAEARFEQRLIEGAAVVSDQHFELLQMLGERAQLAGLFAEVAHEKLAHAKTLRRDAAHADQKRVGARASRQAGGFGIQEAPFLGRNAADLAVRDGIQQIVREVFQIHDADAAVAALAFVQFFGFVVDAVRG